MIVRDRDARRGVSLIELLVVITVLAVLLGLCAITIQLLLRVGSDAQARRSAAASLGRLAEQFRADVHACDDVEVRPSAGLRLVLKPGVVIEYRVHAGSVARVESGEGRASRHESFVLGRHDTAAFDRRDEGARRFLALVIGHRERPGTIDPARPTEILALVGKDRPAASRPEGGQTR
jgi:prepilin-type N-terminal cleavage/methylation domain-containing protein